ncbi:GGDEF domain-containing protein [Sphingorhabdus sp.]|jgi:diguanylate cyclase|uniref:GGDEF domain-containing protein n=1 Tax=Sphingorhabdus sp. TaxID=1902408 RepID=UPI003BB1344D|nr:GGDEF domain-containing protein [Sphingomonadales bacterium]MBK9432311.1 GGDEF domain-containing protein [Sphingomonadales bacterium]MBL0022156.1 GGDEF domain-containing protein [Sphingomonadales bacterium]
MLRVHTQKQVIRYTALITGLAVAAPVAVVAGILSAVPGIPSMAILIGIAMATLIPLFITPPLAYFGLNLLRMMNQTIEKVDQQIRFDGLTGVFNRSYMLDSIRARQVGGPLMIVDADHFKRINDVHGHAVGDAALVVIANTISKTVGAYGLVGRLGGEEFAVFLPGHDRETGMEIATAICANIRAINPLIDGKHVPLSVSIGCTMHPASTVIGASLKNADDLLYHAKNEGRDRAEFDAGPLPEVREVVRW